MSDGNTSSVSRGGQRAALGISAKSASSQKPRALTPAERQERIAQSRRRRWRIQNKAKRLLPGERVCGCMSGVRPTRDGVTVLRGASGAHYGGLVTCGSVWMCPVCAAKITEQRRTKELQPALEVARSSHLRVLMFTFTFSHHDHQALRPLVAALTAAQRKMKSGRGAKDRNARYGVIGSVRALEVTWGEASGWHPHVHELVFLPVEADHEAYAAEVRAAWKAAAAKLGLTMNEHGFDWTETDKRIGEYVSKWGVADEMTKWHIKQGGDERMTPFQLLAASDQGDERAGRLFVEYARAFKGRRQLVWSAGLRAILGLQEQEQTDEELAASQDEPAEVLGVLTRDAWKVVIANDARVDVLEAAEAGGWPAVVGVIEALGGTLENAA